MAGVGEMALLMGVSVSWGEVSLVSLLLLDGAMTVGWVARLSERPASFGSLVLLFRSRMSQM